MKRMTVAIGLLILAVLVGPGFWTLAGSDAKATLDEPKEHLQAPEDLPTGECLGKTVKLTFTLVGEEERSFIVHSATSRFLISHDVSEPDFDHAIKITGQLQPVEAADRVLVTFGATLHHAEKNAGIDVTFQTCPTRRRVELGTCSWWGPGLQARWRRGNSASGAVVCCSPIRNRSRARRCAERASTAGLCPCSNTRGWATC